MSSSSWGNHMEGTSLQTPTDSCLGGMHNGNREEEAGDGGWAAAGLVTARRIRAGYIYYVCI